MQLLALAAVSRPLSNTLLKLFKRAFLNTVLEIS